MAMEYVTAAEFESLQGFTRALITPFRLCRIQGDPNDRSEPGLQAVYAFCHDQRGGYGRLFRVRVRCVCLCAVRTLTRRRVCRSMLPETKGLSLEAMDVLFGAVSSELREAFIQREERALGEKNEVSSLRLDLARV